MQIFQNCPIRDFCKIRLFDRWPPRRIRLYSFLVILGKSILRLKIQRGLLKSHTIWGVSVVIGSLRALFPQFFRKFGLIEVTSAHKSRNGWNIRVSSLIHGDIFMKKPTKIGTEEISEISDFPKNILFSQIDH